MRTRVRRLTILLLVLSGCDALQQNSKQTGSPVIADIQRLSKTFDECASSTKAACYRKSSYTFTNDREGIRVNRILVSGIPVSFHNDFTVHGDRICSDINSRKYYWDELRSDSARESVELFDRVHKKQGRFSCISYKIAGPGTFATITTIGDSIDSQRAIEDYSVGTSLFADLTKYDLLD